MWAGGKMYKEIFVKIDGYDDYFISDHGQVISTKNNKIKYLSPGNNGRGYLQVYLSKNGKQKNKKIHRLIAEHFIDNPNNLPQVDHIDQNKTNNNINNLRWVSHQQNLFNTKAKGYYLRKDTGKYKAYINLDNKLIHLGHYDTEEEARQAYLDAKEKYHII